MNFKEKVIQTIKKIPRGKVASYGQIASICGIPRAARQVGGILRASNSNSVPWWRVMNNKGILSIKGNWVATKEVQKQLLEQEGVLVTSNFSINIEQYRHNFK